MSLLAQPCWEEAQCWCCSGQDRADAHFLQQNRCAEGNGVLKRSHFYKKIVYWKHWDILLQIRLRQFSCVWRLWELLTGRRETGSWPAWQIRSQLGKWSWTSQMSKGIQSTRLQDKVKNGGEKWCHRHNSDTYLYLINIFTEKAVLNHLIFNPLLPVGDTSPLFQHIPRLQSHPRTTEPSAPPLRCSKSLAVTGHEILGLCSWKAPHFLTLKSVPAFQSSRNRQATGCLVANS